MSVHITKTYNIGGLIGLRQNAVKNAGETLGFKEMSLFKFPDAYDSDDELHVRMDGIIASLCPEDIVIFQHPSGESPRYDGFLFEHLRRWSSPSVARSERWMSARATAQCSILSYYLNHRKIRFQMSWRESLCITMNSVTERISSDSMSISR